MFGGVAHALPFLFCPFNVILILIFFLLSLRGFSVAVAQQPPQGMSTMLSFPNHSFYVNVYIFPCANSIFLCFFVC